MIFPIVLDKRDSSRRRPLIRFVASSPTLLLSPIAHLSCSTKTHVCSRNGPDSVLWNNLTVFKRKSLRHSSDSFQKHLCNLLFINQLQTGSQKTPFYPSKGRLLLVKRICIAIPSM